LQIDTVEYRKFENSITLNGKVTANQDNVVQVFPMVSGKIQDIHVMLGDHVNKGQILGVIKSPEMAGYSSSLINAQTNLEVTQKNLQAAKEMFEGGLSSQQDYIAAKASYQQALAELARVKEVIQVNGGGTQGNYLVTAPISGFIIEKNATNGMDIRSDNGNDLFTISDLKNIWVIGDVYESNIPNVHLGDSVDITTLSYPDTIFHGKIDKVMNVLDPVNKVMTVRVPLPNPGYLLKPQMFASVTVLEPENKEMLAVPSSAVIFDHSQYYVLVFNSRTNVVITPVQIVKTTRKITYISGGVQEGQRVIASQALLIYGALNS
ncbi:MAG: efflux RND transporter periplasmic adaptor subunit, partial [Chitinophagaceae bacterium]